MNESWVATNKWGMYFLASPFHAFIPVFTDKSSFGLNDLGISKYFSPTSYCDKIEIIIATTTFFCYFIVKTMH